MLPLGDEMNPKSTSSLNSLFAVGFPLSEARAGRRSTAVPCAVDRLEDARGSETLRYQLELRPPRAGQEASATRSREKYSQSGSSNHRRLG